MKKKFILLSLVVLLVCGVLSGCSFSLFVPTTESVLDKMSENLGDVNSMEADISIVLDMNVASEGLEVPATVSGELSVSKVNTEDGYVTHDTTEMSVNLMGMEQEQVSESYTVAEGGTATEYTYNSEFDVWVKEEVDVKDSDITTMDVETFKEVLTLSEELETYDGVECYVLTGSIDFDTMEDMGMMDSGSLKDMTGDISEPMSLTLYIDKETFYPECFIFSIEDIASEEDGVTTSINELSITIDIEGVNTLDDIKIPEEVLSAEEVIGEFESDDEEEYSEKEEGSDIEEPAEVPQETDKPDSDTEEKVGAYSIDGVQFFLNHEVSDFEDAGWHISDDCKVRAEDFAYGVGLENPNYDSVIITLRTANYSDVEVDVADSNVEDFYINCFDALRKGEAYPSVEVYGVGIGSSVEEVEAVTQTKFESSTATHYELDIEGTSYSVKYSVNSEYGVYAISVSCPISPL